LKNQYRGLEEGFKAKNWDVPTPPNESSLSVISSIGISNPHQDLLDIHIYQR
jgi:hypothetical protein